MGTEPVDGAFRLVCAAGTLAGTPDGWVTETLRDGTVSLLIDRSGLDAIDAAARALDQTVVSVMRREGSAEEQEEEVITFADAMPLIWVAAQFSERARTWARARGPMTLLVSAQRTLPEDELARIARFVALLARQTD